MKLYREEVRRCCAPSADRRFPFDVSGLRPGPLGAVELLYFLVHAVPEIRRPGGRFYLATSGRQRAGASRGTDGARLAREEPVPCRRVRRRVHRGLRRSPSGLVRLRMFPSDLSPPGATAIRSSAHSSPTQRGLGSVLCSGLPGERQPRRPGSESTSPVDPGGLAHAIPACGSRRNRRNATGRPATVPPLRAVEAAGRRYDVAGPGCPRRRDLLRRCAWRRSWREVWSWPDGTDFSPTRLVSGLLPGWPAIGAHPHSSAAEPRKLTISTLFLLQQIQRESSEGRKIDRIRSSGAASAPAAHGSGVDLAAGPTALASSGIGSTRGRGPRRIGVDVRLS